MFRQSNATSTKKLSALAVSVVFLPIAIIVGGQTNANAATNCQQKSFAPGDRNDCVVIIQKALNQKANAGLATDGYIGPVTESRIKKFQTAHGIKATGVVGQPTWKALLGKPSSPVAAATVVKPKTVTPVAPKVALPAPPLTPAAAANKHDLVAVIYRGGAACKGCSESVARVLAKDTQHKWTVKYVGENEPMKLNAQSLAGADMYVQPGGGTINEDWPKLTTTGQQAVQTYTENGGRYLGLCLGGFFAGKFGNVGWGWIDDVDTYSGPKYSDGNIVHTVWSGQKRSMWWEGGSDFGTSKPGTQVLGTYENGAAAAVVVPAGSGKAAGIGPHAEADSGWYSSKDRSADADGYDADLLLKVTNTLLAY